MRRGPNAGPRPRHRENPLRAERRYLMIAALRVATSLPSTESLMK
jgi:hypothetical protein